MIHKVSRIGDNFDLSNHTDIYMYSIIVIEICHGTNDPIYTILPLQIKQRVLLLHYLPSTLIISTLLQIYITIPAYNNDLRLLFLSSFYNVDIFHAISSQHYTTNTKHTSHLAFIS